MDKLVEYKNLLPKNMNRFIKTILNHDTIMG